MFSGVAVLTQSNTRVLQYPTGHETLAKVWCIKKCIHTVLKNKTDRVIGEVSIAAARGAALPWGSYKDEVAYINKKRYECDDMLSRLKSPSFRMVRNADTLVGGKTPTSASKIGSPLVYASAARSRTKPSHSGKEKFRDHCVLKDSGNTHRCNAARFSFMPRFQACSISLAPAAVESDKQP